MGHIRSVEGPVIQVTERTEFEDGLSIRRLGIVFRVCQTIYEIKVANDLED